MKKDYLINDQGRECSKCEQFKDWSQYHAGHSANNKAGQCRDCKNKIDRERRLKKIALSGKAVKKQEPELAGGRACSKCGEFKRWSEYHVGHSINNKAGQCKVCKNKLAVERKALQKAGTWKPKFNQSVFDDPALKDWFKNLPKLINPKTGMPFARGDEFNGKYVWGIKSFYSVSGVKLSNKEYEYRPLNLLSYDGMINNWAGDRLNSKQREFREGLKPYKVDCTLEHLIDIFPKDMKCPILDIKMRFGGSYDNSVQLDRINNDLGYLDGNVAWISAKANRAKGNLNSDELYKIADWLKDKNF